jgi:FKBP-type peptidyl-prolyl cis-trans isomerase
LAQIRKNAFVETIFRVGLRVPKELGTISMKRYLVLLFCVFALSAYGSQSDSNKANAQSANNSDPSPSASTDSGTNSHNGSNPPGEFKNKKEKRSYALGMDIGNSLKQLPIKLNVDALVQGVRDEASGHKTRLTQKQLHSVMQNLVADMQAAQKKKVQQEAKANLEKGQKFLAANKKKPGVKTLEDGLQYKVIKPGSGPKPDANDSVTVDYVGKLIDGTVFDSSKKHGHPVTFPVNAVIPGWTEALQMMKQGAKYKLFIPPKLAYGERGAGTHIGPNQTLIFNVHLIKVHKKKGNSGQGQDQNQEQQTQPQDQGQQNQDQKSQDHSSTTDRGQQQ